MGRGRGRGRRIPMDIIGSRETGAVAVVELREGDDPAEVAAEVMRRHRHVRSVLAKAGPREGRERLRRLSLLAGDPNTEVIHREHGYRIKLDPTKVYFSPREGEDRRRVAEEVEPGERVLVMFAGVGPYAVAIGRIQPEVGEVIGVEVNEDAVRYFEENIRLNGLEGRVEVIRGDVREVCPRLFGRFDRVLMPLPLGARDYVDLALRCLSPRGGILHYYAICRGEEGVGEEVGAVSRVAGCLGLRVEVKGWERVGHYAPGADKVRIDFIVSPIGGRDVSSKSGSCNNPSRPEAF